MTQQETIEVSAAVLMRADGTFLLAQRPAGKSYAGYWEFPGGKIEPGESPHQALCRELFEELGIEVTSAYPWLLREFTYPHGKVKLRFFRVIAWEGEPHGRENQQLSWQNLSDVIVAPILPANTPIIRALSLPSVYAISNATLMGKEVFMRRLELSLSNGLRVLQLREKSMPYDDLIKLSIEVVQLAHRYDAKVLINGDEEMANKVRADGVHFSAAQLLGCLTRPKMAWCGASCHSAEELKRAGELGFDFALLSPVLPTMSHPDAVILGWEKFAELAAEASLPIYALGGLKIGDLSLAQRHGAHGISLLSQAW